MRKSLKMVYEGRVSAAIEEELCAGAKIASHRLQSKLAIWLCCKGVASNDICSWCEAASLRFSSQFVAKSRACFASGFTKLHSLFSRMQFAHRPSASLEVGRRHRIFLLRQCPGLSELRSYLRKAIIQPKNDTYHTRHLYDDSQAYSCVCLGMNILVRSNRSLRLSSRS
jgi:hypothetical protein